MCLKPWTVAFKTEKWFVRRIEDLLYWLSLGSKEWINSAGWICLSLVLWLSVFCVLSFAKDMTMCSLLGFAARRPMCVFPLPPGTQPEKAMTSRSHLGMLPRPALNWGTEPAAHSRASEFTWIRLTAEGFIIKDDLSGVPALQLLVGGPSERSSHDVALSSVGRVQRGEAALTLPLPASGSVGTCLRLLPDSFGLLRNGNNGT